MIENITVMDKPVAKARGLSRGMWIAVGGGVVALAAVLFAIPTIRRWSRAERSIAAAQVRIGEVTRGELIRDTSADG